MNRLTVFFLLSLSFAWQALAQHTPPDELLFRAVTTKHESNIQARDSSIYLWYYLSTPLVAENSEAPRHEKPFTLHTPQLPKRLKSMSDSALLPIPDISKPIKQIRNAQEMMALFEYKHLDLFETTRQTLLPYSPDYSLVLPDDNLEISDVTPSLQFPLINGDEKLIGIIPKRRYWTTGLESTVQFSQNYISENWYKGGSSNLNIFTRNYINKEYNRNRIRWTNELESKLSLYNAARDTINRYRVSDDLLRLRSNFGYKAFNRWYYTLDTEARTQLFKNFEENSTKILAAFLAPLTFNAGLGMKYDLNKKSRKVYGRKTKLSVNIAPLSYSFKWSARKDIDLARHGFAPGETVLHQVGSTVKAELNFDYNRRINFQSRLYFSTTYENMEAEWENTVNLSLTRFLSTRFYLYLRYDDKAPIKPPSKTHLQINELFSFGFFYRL